MKRTAAYDLFTKKKPWQTSAFIASAVLLAFACTRQVAYTPEEDDLKALPHASAALGPGDVIEIRVYQEKDLSGDFQIGANGMIDYPLLGSIVVEGLTPAQVAQKIREGLADGLVKNPFVTVTVKERVSKRIYVLGQVNKPGTFPYEEGMTIIHAITLAGGFTKTARTNAVVVTRVIGGAETKTVVPVSEISEGKAKNFLLRPGDIVFVPESIL